MRFRTFGIIILLCIPLACISQQMLNTDELLQELPKSSGDARIEVLRRLCIAYMGNDRDKSLDYGRQAVGAAEKTGNDTLVARTLITLSAAYQNHGLVREGIAQARLAAAAARRTGYEWQLVESLGFIAVGFMAIHQTDSAFQYGLRNLDIAQRLNDTLTLLNTYELLASVKKDLKQYAEAEQYYQAELPLLANSPLVFEKARLWNSWGELLIIQSRYAEALPMFEKGREYYRQMDYPAGEASVWINIGKAYLYTNQPDAAERAYREALHLNRGARDPDLDARSFAGLGATALHKGLHGKAHGYLQQAEQIARENHFYAVLKEVYGTLHGVAVAEGNFSQAWQYKDRMEMYADSVVARDVRERVAQYQVWYQTAEKEKEIAQQRAQLLEQESVLFRQRTWIIALLIGALALAGLGYLFHNRYRMRQKSLLDAAIIREQQLGLNAVIDAQENERRRIAKDLHDGIAQELVALNLGFNALRRKIGANAPQEAVQLGELAQQLDASCTELRNLSQVMMPPVLEQKGLVPSLVLLLQRTAAQASLEVHIDAGEVPERLGDKIETGLYRIVQELLNNVLKHARATKVHLQIYQADANLILRLEDDGTGFDFESAKQKGSMGILNILSRAKALDGVFFAEKRTPNGTIATVQVPLSY